MPFTFIEVHGGGLIYTCCPSWINNYSIGSLLNNSFDEIWYSKEAIELRRKILNQDYSMCNTYMCGFINKCTTNETDKFKEYADYPKHVKFCHDYECNYKCITCRDNVITTDDNILNFLNSMTDKLFIPLLKNADSVSLSGSGDPFASRHYKELIKAIVKTYPNIKFELHTNGSLCNEKTCEKLGILNKLSIVDVSIHATNEKTYKLITGNGNFNNVLKNLKWLSDLKKTGKLDTLIMSFVVHKSNYKEMPDFVRLAEELNASASFWEYRNWGTSEMGKYYSEVAVFEESHPEFKDFQKMLTQDIFKSPHCTLNPLLKEIAEKH